MFLLASMVCTSSIIPAFAAEGNANSVTYQTVTNESNDKSPVTEVKASIKSQYTVTLPKTMTVNNGDNAYNVNVKGDLAGNETISVVPDATVSLSSEGKDAVVGNITQEKQAFVYADASKTTDGVLTGTDAAGNININGLTAGHWTGTFNFNVGTNVTNIGEDIDSTMNNLSTYGIATTGDVVIPEYVTDSNGMKHKVANIRNEAFEGSNITSITIPNSVTIIGNYAFMMCYKLTSITIPDSVTMIGSAVFRDCRALQSITYKGVAYTNKTELMNALKANNVTMGSYVFDGTALQ